MKPPNLLFIYTDEQAFNTLAAYGNEQIEMPIHPDFVNPSLRRDTSLSQHLTPYSVQ